MSYTLNVAIQWGCPHLTVCYVLLIWFVRNDVHSILINQVAAQYLYVFSCGRSRLQRMS